MNSCKKLYNSNVNNKSLTKFIKLCYTTLQDGENILKNTKIKPTDSNKDYFNKLYKISLTQDISLLELLRRPELKFSDIEKTMHFLGFDSEIDEFKCLKKNIKFQIETQIKYQGYIDRQMKEIEQLKLVGETKIPENFVYDDVKGLSTEALMKLKKINPINLSQASRISGVTPAAVSILSIYIKKHKREKRKNIYAD